MNECTYSAPVSDDDIVQAINDHANSDLIEHLATCEHCRRRYETALNIETQLRKHLFRFDCPTVEQIMAYAEGLPSRYIEKHLQHCPACRQEFADYKDFMQPTDEKDISVPTIPEALAPTIYRMTAVSAHDAKGRGKDSRTKMPVLRGAKPTPIIHEAAEGTRLFLDLRQRGNRWLVTGQIESENIEAWYRSLVIVRQENILRATGVNDTGNFSIVVPKDTTTPFQFRITRPDRTVLLLDDVRFPQPNA